LAPMLLSILVTHHHASAFINRHPLPLLLSSSRKYTVSSVVVATNHHLTAHDLDDYNKLETINTKAGKNVGLETPFPQSRQELSRRSLMSQMFLSSIMTGFVVSFPTPSDAVGPIKIPLSNFKYSAQPCPKVRRNKIGL